MKSLKELNKEEKLLLLQAIASGEVDPNGLTEKTLIGFDYKDYFLSLQIAADNSGASIILFGEARRAMTDMKDTLHMDLD
jgi:hypothetical protein